MKNTMLKLLAVILVLSMLFTSAFSALVMAEDTVAEETVDDTTGDDTTGDDTTGDDTTGDDTTGDDTTGDDTTGDDTTGDDTTGDDTTGDDTTGDDTTGDDTTGDDTTGDDTTGDDTTGDDTTGDDTTGDDTTGDDTTDDDDSDDKADDEADTITYEGETGDTVDFDADDFAKVYNDATGKTFKSFAVPKLPSTTYGVLYYDYDGKDEEKIVKGEKIKKSFIDDVSFVPKKECEITIAIVLYGTETDAPEIDGEIKIIVEEDSKTASVISLSGDNDEAIEFSGSKFNSVCKSATGKNLDYVTFTLPSSTYGALYYDYDGDDEEKVSKSDEFYYDDDPDISDVSFVPKSSYKGTVTIKYTGENISGKEFSGTVKIKVSDADDDDDDDDDYDVDTVSYTVYNDDELEFDGDDFYDVFDDAGEDFLGLEFTKVPTTSQGALYDGDDEKIAKGDEFYYDDDPDISDIYFEPKSSYSGTITLTYKGYYTSSKYIEGKITIKVKDADGDDDEDDEDDDEIKTITVKADEDEEITMNATSMNSAFKAAVGSTLSYVKFTLPSSSAGKLYYDYDGDDEDTVSASDKYYYSGSSNNLIKKVSFVPKYGYTGTVTIKYNAYKSGSSTAYPGVIKIQYGSSSSSTSEAATVNYKGVADTGVKFGFTEFNNASIKATDEACETVRLGAVAGGAGTLYLNYGESTQKVVTPGTTFWIDKMPSISSVTFVPSAGFKGTASISFTGVNNEGDSFTGYIKIEITEKPAAVTPVVPAPVVPAPVVPAPVAPIVPQKVFADVAEGSWYKDIVYKVCAAELMKGTGDTTFNPEGNMTVAEAITMACRIHNQAKGGKDSDFVAYGNNWYDVYVNYAIVNGIIKYGDFAVYDRKATRAEMAYIFYHSVTSDKLAPINSWVVPDVNKNETYGVEIYALYDAGILAGDAGTGNFRSKDNVIRAEAATILARLGGIVDRVKK